MKLSDLLSELRENILHDRSDRTAGSADYLWTDATLVRYINEAQNRFARKSLIIRDATTPEVTQVTLVEGQTQYDLHPSVIAVISAKVSTATMDLSRVGHSLLGEIQPRDQMFIDPSQYSGLPPGAPVAYSTDEEVVADDSDTMSSMSMRIYPEPNDDADGTIIKLRVVHMPIDELVIGSLSAQPEIPSIHHLEMLDWAAYLALRIVDSDAGNPKRAAEFANSFEEHVRVARNVVMRKLFAPMPWGYGRNGWSWER